MRARCLCGFFLWVVLAAIGVARGADCDQAITRAEVKRCVAAQLRASDGQINSIYQSVMSRLDANSKVTLRHQQRAWIKRRDAACGLSEHDASLEDWYRTVLADARQAVCATHYTTDRIAELKNLQESRSSGLHRPAASLRGLVPTRLDMFSDQVVRTGLWYFEVSIDKTRIGATGPAMIWSGCDDHHLTAGSVVWVRSGQPSSLAVHLGFALDLIAGKLYVRSNGEWKDGVPGSSGGLDATPGQPYRCGIESSVPIAELVKGSMVSVDLGSTPFEYSLPAGYRALIEAPKQQ